ncbi:MAG: hypothetical protein AAFQ43_12285, partial [Bacteroidota bacterium]
LLVSVEGALKGFGAGHRSGLGEGAKSTRGLWRVGGKVWGFSQASGASDHMAKAGRDTDGAYAIRPYGGQNEGSKWASGGTNRARPLLIPHPSSLIPHPSSLIPHPLFANPGGPLAWVVPTFVP